jgi:hypothetical protein
MTYFDSRSVITTALDTAAHGGGILDRIWIWLWRPVMLDHQRRKLNYLSDRILKDIGLSRSDIDSVATYLIERRVDVTRDPRGR